MDNPESVGKLVGIVFWGVIAILGLIKCVSIARRDTTSALCVHSLSLVIIGYLLMVLMALLQFTGPGKALPLLGITLIAFAGFILFVVSLTVAIIGLVLYRRSFAPDGSRRKYRQGRKQAIWAIVLNCIFMIIFISGFVGGMTVNKRARSLMSQIPVEEFVFEEMNFRLTPPDAAWVELDAEEFNPDCSVMMMRNHPQVFATVIAERPGVESGMTVEQLMEVARSNVRSMDSGAVFSEVEPCAFNGISGLRYSTDAEVGIFKGSYVSWCCVTNGFCYQIMVWCAQRDKDDLREHAGAVMQGFELIDPARRSYSSGDGPFGMRGSSFFGYSINLQDTEWMAWENLKETDAFADEGGLHPEGYRFCITPLVLPFDDAAQDIVHDAFLKLYEFDGRLPEDQLTPITRQGLDGLAYSYSNAENQCVEQLLMSANCAYLVSVWSPLDQADGLRPRAEEVFASVNFNAAEGSYKAMKELPADRQVSQANMINKVGLAYYHAGQFEKALEWFRSGFDCSSTNAVYFGNMLAAHSEMSQYKDGLALLATASPAIREAQSIQSWQASLLQGTGMIEESDRVFTSLFESGYRDDDDFISWTRMRADNGKWEGLDAAFTDYMGAKPTVALQAHQLDLYYDKGDFQKVADLCERYLEKQGFSPDIAFWQIDACQELGLYNEALEICGELIEKGYATVDAYQEKALCEYRLNWYRQSKASLEAALALNPRNETTQDWLATVSAELGEGNNSHLKDYIEPVNLPEVFSGEWDRGPDPEFGKKFGAFYDRFWVLWEYRKGGGLKRTDVYHIKVLDNAGVSAFSSLEYGFNPVDQEIFVNTLLVRSAEGEVIGRGAVKDYYILDDNSDGLISEDKKLVLPVPGLSAGCSIEVVVTRAYVGDPEEFYFKQHFLAAGYPVQHAAIYLSGDVDEVIASARNDVKEVRKEEGVLWKNQTPYAYKWEPMQLPASRFVPCVILGPAGDSWEAGARSYLDSIKDRLEGSPELTAKARALVEGCESDEEKYAALVHWIRSSFTYKPLEFGRSASIPDTAETTLSYRYGDCKDFSVLLKVLLEAVKVECHLVLVNSSGDVYPEIPTTDQFNHMIVYLPKVRGGLFVDPTDQEADAFLAVPQGLHEGQALILDPELPVLETLPGLVQDSSTCFIQRTVTVRPGRPVTFTDHVTLDGYCAAWMRNALKDRQQVKWIEWYQSGFADVVTGLKVVSASAEHLDDPSKKLVVDLAFTMDGVAPDDGNAPLDISPLWVRYYLAFQNVQARKNPFRVKYPMNLEMTIKFNLPDGFRLQEPALKNVEGKSRYLDWAVSDQLRFSCNLKVGEFDAAEYADFLDTMNKAIQSAHVKGQVEMETASGAAE